MTTLNRLGSANSFDLALNNLSNRQSALSSLQEQLTAGKRVVRASDDPTGAAQAERAITRMERIKADQRALEAQRNSIVSAESTLGSISDALQNFRELVVSSGNATYTVADRQSKVLELMGLRDQIVTLSNTKDSNGLPLFSSLGSALAPFSGPSAMPQDYTFNGLPGQAASTELSIPYALDGNRAFMFQSARDGVYNVAVSNNALVTSNVTLTPPALPNGSAYTISIGAVDSTTVPGTTTVTYDVAENPNVGGPYTGLTASFPSDKPGSITVSAMPGLSLTLRGTPSVGDTVKVNPSASLFSVLDNAIRDIGSATSSAAAAQAVGQALNNIDIGMDRVSAVRGQAGDLLNRADRITDNQSKRSIQLEGDRSRAEDIDMIKGLSDFENQNVAYQAALQTYAQIKKLSLFNFIS